MSSIAARRYVKAVRELSEEAGTLDALLDQLQTMASLLEESAELKQLLVNPSVSHKVKLSVFDEIGKLADLNDTVLGLMRLLIRKSRVELLGDIIEEYQAQENERKGVVAMQVTTASALTDDLKEQLRRQFEESTGKKVELNAAVDAGLIGGMVARIGGTIYDGSIEHQLNLIQQRLGEK